MVLMLQPSASSIQRFGWEPCWLVPRVCSDDASRTRPRPPRPPAPAPEASCAEGPDSSEPVAWCKQAGSRGGDQCGALASGKGDAKQKAASQLATHPPRLHPSQHPHLTTHTHLLHACGRCGSAAGGEPAQLDVAGGGITLEDECVARADALRPPQLRKCALQVRRGGGRVK